MKAKKSHLLIVLTLVLLAAALILPAAAFGKPEVLPKPYWTHGDAMAMLESYPPTDQIQSRLDTFSRGLDIRPFDFYGEIPYYVQDWHVLAFFWEQIEGTDEYGTWTREDAWELLKTIQAEFVLDGAVVEMERSPITQKRGTEDPGVVKTWVVSWGRILAPGELSVGEHTFSATITLYPGTPFEFIWFSEVTFAVHPADWTP
jgi:hypothetical protein